jgi:alkane 1-monooxygenase
MRALLHLLTFVLPASVLAFLTTGPHGLVPTLAAVLSIGALLLADAWAPAETRDPVPVLPDTWFDGILFALVLLHLAVVAALPFHLVGASLLQGVVAVFLVGNTQAQAIVLAHELIHRRPARFRLPGRLLLATVLYEHFYTEHLRGHHKHVATAQDPASARYGERFWPFLLRTVPGQFASAWAIESRRLQAHGWWDPRHRHNRVLHGLIVGWGLAGLVLAAFGPWIALAWLAQAAFAVLLLEGVNFIEHWGLERARKRVQPVDSWDSSGGLTYYMLIGLARHGDHHAHAARPWQDLRLFDDTPKMPWGYMATAYAAVFADGWLLLPRYRAELERTRLGPWREAVRS